MSKDDTVGEVRRHHLDFGLCWSSFWLYCFSFRFSYIFFTWFSSASLVALLGGVFEDLERLRLGEAVTCPREGRVGIRGQQDLWDASLSFLNV